VLLAFALVIPAAGITSVAGANPVSWFATVVLVGLAGISLYEAYRWVVVIVRHGIGIADMLGLGTTWLAWSEIVSVEIDGVVVSLATRGRQVYQVQLDQRAARLLARMVERNLVR
jgi:hypothetical protein